MIVGAVLPAAMPSMINTSLFSLEKATRSSVILGLVGAGGIGIELQVSMDMFRYDEAATIILGVWKKCAPLKVHILKPNYFMA